ncbi:MAG TPA: acyl carrier protein [Fimbriimonadaceae bacterium]|nr:acyl carrier protein [Armatimonadota bacterium]HCM73419.1 acyl carrier protein [Armatimonadota bacterium]HRD32112.1 acyl carrier protein [Fimbriimonadaceae bacterium]HRE93921.1 acyl carrier protein [Fimbriimonadaceae bacterium]HRI72943.1 acyl carrier protein [Fimbriimonadaceae bacterium]
MSENILDRVKKVVKEELNVQDEVSESASFTDDLGADSLDVVELVMAIEEEFGIDVPDEDTQGLKTVQDVVDYIKSKQG